MLNIFSKIKYMDMPLLVTSGILLFVGLVIMYSSSVSGGDLRLYYRQLIFGSISVLAFFFAVNYNYHKLITFNRWTYVGLTLILLFVLLFAREVRGSSRWIDFGFFRFQPAEFCKLAVVLVLARWFSYMRGRVNSLLYLGISFVVVAVPGVLVVLEPDLGSSLIIFGIWAGLLTLSTVRRKFLLALFAIFLLFASFSWAFLLQDFQKHRIEVFLNPNLDPKGKGYNVRQAIIAVGSGGVEGRGLGHGLQSQLKFLPERQTDFIFATLAEEVGFLGSIVLFVIYTFFLLRLLYLVRTAKDSLGSYIISGVFFMFFGQTIINIGMNIGVLPVTGIPLPFISYGGSSMLVSWLSLGVVQSVVVQSKALRF
jgi:rod shape determining protein RodA